jgi:Alpha-glutamyl/putrescinyl thymine pyrophosphorylase clade 3
MPTFCRHNRFIERCPICSKTLVDHSPAAQSKTKPRRTSTKGAPARSRRPRLLTDPRAAGGREVRVHRESRAGDDGYRSALLPGLRASGDAIALAREIAFAHGRLLALGAAPPDLYAEVRALAEADIEQATWMCFLIAYLSPLDGEDPFAGIRLALTTTGDGGAYDGRALGDLDRIPLGPRTSHGPARGTSTLLAYRHWAERAGSQAHAFEGDLAWSPQRRFERCFERLALPGFPRMGRYDLLVTLGHLGLYEMRADALHFISANGSPSGDLTTLAAKRVFAIGDPLNLERRAQALAEAISVPVETLDLALANWGSGARATLGVRSETCDLDALERTRTALEL